MGAGFQSRRRLPRVYWSRLQRLLRACWGNLHVCTAPVRPVGARRDSKFSERDFEISSDKCPKVICRQMRHGRHWICEILLRPRDRPDLGYLGRRPQSAALLGPSSKPLKSSEDKGVASSSSAAGSALRHRGWRSDHFRRNGREPRAEKEWCVVRIDPPGGSTALTGRRNALVGVRPPKTPLPEQAPLRKGPPVTVRFP